jgi:hypothetical protein
MKMAAYYRLVKQLIAEGFDTTPALQAELRERGATFGGQTIVSKPVGTSRTRGPPLQQALKYLSHNRQIQYDKAGHAWLLVDRPTYHPADSAEKLLRENSKTVPKNVDRGILLL